MASTLSSPTRVKIRYFATQIILGLAIILYLIASALQIYIAITDFSDLQLRELYYQLIPIFAISSFSLLFLGIILTYFTMFRVDQITVYMSNLITLGKFGLITLGSVVLLIQIVLVSVFELEIGIDPEHVPYIMVIVGFIVLIYVIGSIFLIWRLEPRMEGEITIQRGLQLISISLVIYVVSIIILVYLIGLIGELLTLIVQPIPYLLLISAFIYSNYTIRDYQVNTISTSSQEVELYTTTDSQHP